MSNDKEKLDQLAQKIDELLAVLKDVSEDLKSISASVKSLAVSQITTARPTTVSAPNVSAQSTRPSSPPIIKSPVSTGPTENLENVEDVRTLFPRELGNMLGFEDKGDYVMIKPKQFLGSENFAKIASTVRGIGGEYVSAGRDSHFRVYKKKS